MKQLYNLTLTKLGNMLKSKNISNTERLELCSILAELRGYTEYLTKEVKAGKKQKE